MGMTAIDAPAGVDGGDDAVRVVHDHADRLFSWRYDRERPQLVTLYNKAAASQWNSVTDLDWSTDVDPERMTDDEPPILALAREAARIPGSPLSSWSEAMTWVIRADHSRPSGAGSPAPSISW